MGTSSAFGGAGGGTPLVPSWLQDDPVTPASTPAPGAAPAADDGANADGQRDGDRAPTTADGGTNPNTAPVNATPKSVNPMAGGADRFRSARSDFSRFSSSGGNDSRSLGRALAGYVSKTTGGSRQAAQRMGSSRGAAAKLINFLNNAQTNGAAEALRTLNLDGLAGRPIEEIFGGLTDYICPDGGSIDEGIARDAFVETIADLATAGVTDLDALTADQVKTVFELYATHAIEARICNDIGTKVITLPASIPAAERVQAQLRDFIQRSVSDALSSASTDPLSLTADRVMSFVTGVYQNAFEVLQTIGAEAAAAR